MLNPRQQAWNSYRQVATQTAPPGQLVLMLYEGAIRFLNKALAGFSEEDPAERNETINNNIIRTQQIIQELNASLDVERGGELALHLRRIYFYVDWRLGQSNIAKETSGIHDAIERITILRDAWAAMLENRRVGSESERPTSALALA